jgi:hypothetical protein
VAATEDPYIPLKLTWDVPTPSGVLYAFLEGGSGGYVELKFSRENFALYQLIVVDSPRAERSEDLPLDIQIRHETSPCVSADIWN